MNEYKTVWFTAYFNLINGPALSSLLIKIKRIQDFKLLSSSFDDFLFFSAQCGRSVGGGMEPTDEAH